MKRKARYTKVKKQKLLNDIVQRDFYVAVQDTLLRVLVQILEMVSNI